MQTRRLRGTVRSYIRVSGADQDRIGTSPEAQRAAHLSYCRAHGLPDPVWYFEVESGSESAIELRDEQIRLQREAVPGDLVLVCAVDRWSRDIVHAVASVRALVARGVRWLSLREGIDASTPQGDSTLGIKRTPTRGKATVVAHLSTMTDACVPKTRGLEENLHEALAL